MWALYAKESVMDPITISLFTSIVFSLYYSNKLAKFNKYLKDKYSNEWNKSFESSMKIKPKIIQPFNIRFSIESGFLSKQNDPVINSFLKLEKRISSIALAIIFIGYIVALVL
jgi:hypothetical protein